MENIASCHSVSDSALSKKHLLTMVLGNTQEAVAQSRHDGKKSWLGR